MTSTEFSIGMNEGRNSSKVLKPPGGGSSDIFGTEGDIPEAENQKKEDTTKDRLFGSDADLQTPSKVDRMKSSIFVNDDAKNEAKLNKMKFVHRNPITGETIEIDKQKFEQNGIGTNIEERKVEELTKENGESVGDAGAKQPKATSIRVRQPPGGKSSGIF